MNRSYLTENLKRYTIVQKLEFLVDMDDGVCTLILDLAQSEIASSKAIRAKFAGVTSLCLNEFGGGITQLLLLNIEDIKDQQLDRIQYRITELERSSLSFMCNKINIVNTR